MTNESSSPAARFTHGRQSSLTVSRATIRLLTLITASGLAVDAYVHWHLAANFDTLIGTASPNISQGQLFRLEAMLALAAMVLVLVTRRRIGALVAFLVAAGGLGAVLLYAFIDVGGIGPIPDMYDPTWYTEKIVSVVAQGVAAAAALCLLVLPSVPPKDQQPTEQPTDK
jgi:hypothetical protein